MRMLIISDDSEASHYLVTGFKSTGFGVDHCINKDQGSFWARTTDYDLILVEHSAIFDSLPFCQQIRDKGKTMPIVIFSDTTDVKQKVNLLNAGADDFLPKKCPMAELQARVRAILRRGPNLTGDILQLGDLTLDVIKYQVKRGKKQIQLTKKEFSLLEYMLRNPEVVISRSDLIEHIWDINADLFSNTLETHILNLRKKIEVSNKPKLIHTISGRGYKIALKK